MGKTRRFAVGTDVMDAFDQIDVLTKAAQIYINARCMGFEPDGMTKEQMQGTDGRVPSSEINIKSNL